MILLIALKMSPIFAYKETYVKNTQSLILVLDEAHIERQI